MYSEWVCASRVSAHFPNLARSALLTLSDIRPLRVVFAFLPWMHVGETFYFDLTFIWLRPYRPLNGIGET